MMPALSVLDLVAIGEGKSLAEAIRESCQLAQHAEKCGFRRYWVAEHHDMPGIGSSATALIIQAIAAATSAMRVGAGGIMLPNHSPLAVAEQFGTLDAMYPGRINLGLGRAPGAAGPAVRAIRRGAPERDFGEDVIELLDYLADNGRRPAHGVGGRHDVEVWILGSSLYGANLAAALGLPYAFASHFAPQQLGEALAHYRRHFQPSPYLDRPHVMVGASVFAADTQEEADYVASSHRKWTTDLRFGRLGLLPKPREGYIESLSEMEKLVLGEAMTCSVAGDRAKVGAWIHSFLDRTGADELIIDSRIYDPAARRRSYQLAAEAAAEFASARENRAG